eukprot:gnl/Chilomastix_cuspidata/6147.p1 GENE.gnl/Chilomastix_cuspidata/6147~~gnl/Chilomastix_cuspidata/6147.p1  ORF type:complete len:156 (-),score=39.71 gnl/Chilomastix_cuspidata/6147:56-523(-)
MLFECMVEVDGEAVALRIWAVSSAQKFSSIPYICRNGAHGVLLTYARDSARSAESVEQWREQLAGHIGDIPLVVVANKADLPAAVAHGAVRASMEEHGLGFVEASARLGTGVSEAFELLMRMMIDNEPHPDADPSAVVDLSAPNPRHPGRGCGCQ